MPTAVAKPGMPGDPSLGWQEDDGSSYPAQGGHLLDLESCVRIAVAENPLLRAAEEGVSVATEAVGVATAPYYPKVGVEAGYRRFDTHLFFPDEVALQDTTLGATDDWGAAFTVGYTLYDHGQRRAERSAARASLAASAEDMARVRQDVVFAVHRAYYRALASRSALAVAETRRSRGQDHLEIARARNAAGAVSRSDVLRARVEVADAELVLVRAREVVQIADGELNTAMGLPVEIPIRVADPGAPVPPPAPGATALALERAMSQRPELSVMRQRIVARASQTAAIAGAYGPRLVAAGSVGLRDSRFLPEDQNWAVGIAFKLPLFSGFARTHELARADAEVRVLDAEAAALANRIRLEVWTAASDVQAAHQAVQQSEVLRDVAEESLGFVRTRYEAGASTITELLDADSELAQADSAVVTAVLGARLAGARLLRAQGDL